MTDKLTDEQATLLAMAAENGSILLTAMGSPNDILWGEFADRGFMEPADLPKDMQGGNLTGWKVTDELRAALARQPATPTRRA